MNERFIRCSECGMPHEDGLRTCPTTGKPIVRSSGRGLSVPTPAPIYPVQPGQAAPPVAPGNPAPAARGSARVPVDSDLIGTLIGGKYRVRDVLGEGGMGTVFEALREGLGNMVAIKVLHQNQVHKRDSVQRFHHEARAAARIGHPNICEVYDVGSLPDGRPYLVMDRLTGITLADRIQAHGGLPFQEVVDTLTQVLSGLHAAHEKAIIHRDIKPENVFLSQRVGCPPIAKILDFGVSKVMAEHAQASTFADVEITRTGVVLGTPYYLAPEQARGERGLDARVDLYACGVLLYEALTGRRPFRAANYNALLITILTSAPRPAREIRPDLPAGFGRLLDKAMARDPVERFQTALEFQAALQPYSQNPLARRSTAPSRPPPRPSTGFPPAPPILVPSKPPRAPAVASLDAPASSVEDLAAFLESASGDALPAASTAMTPLPPTPFVPKPFPPVTTIAPRAVPRPASIAPPAVAPTSASVTPRAPELATPAHAITAVTTPAAASAPAPSTARSAKSSPRAGQNRREGSPRADEDTKGRPSGWHGGNFDDQATDVDLPRQFRAAPSEPSPRAKSDAAAPPTKAASLDAFAPRRSAPVLGPPLRPPGHGPFADETATEIMSAAIRSKISEPGKKADSVVPAPSRAAPLPPRPSRPPPRE